MRPGVGAADAFTVCAPPAGRRAVRYAITAYRALAREGLYKSLCGCSRVLGDNGETALFPTGSLRRVSISAYEDPQVCDYCGLRLGRCDELFACVHGSTQLTWRVVGNPCAHFEIGIRIHGPA